MEYKYHVTDDEHRIKDAEFDNFGDAFDYAQGGLYTYIERFPVDGDEEDFEVVWTWDDTRDRDEAIADVEGYENPKDQIEEDVEIEAKADDPDELAKFARLVLGDDYKSFEQDFDDAPVEAELHKPAYEAPKGLIEEKEHDYVIRNYNSYRYVDDAMNALTRNPAKAKHFKTEEEADEFMSDGGKYKNWRDHYALVDLNESKEDLDDFITGPQSDEFAFDYDAWPDYEEDGEENVENSKKDDNCEDCDKDDLSDDEFVEELVKGLAENRKRNEEAEVCPECGKNPCECKHDDLEECGLTEAAEEENTDVADEEEQDLNSKVAEALDACLPEDDAEDFDPHELIDAVLAYFDTDDEKDYIKSIVCPEDESDRDESEDKK